MTLSLFILTALMCVLLCLCIFLSCRCYYRRSSIAVGKGIRQAGISLENRLEVGKKELELVFDAIPQQICIVDKQYNIIRANKSYASFVGLPIRNVPGEQCYHLSWNKGGVCEDCPVKTTFDKGIAVIKMRCSRMIEDSVRHFEISSFPVFNEEGRVVRAIEIMNDITEEKRMIEQLIRSEKLASIGNMTAGIAHEMNNPLSGISGNAANLLKMPQKYGLNEKGISRVNTILKSAEHATAIMDDLLNLSRHPEQTSAIVNVNALIVKTVNSVHLEETQDIERQVNLDEKLPPFSCDPAKIQQVIIHIVTNALQAIVDKKKSLPPGGSYRGVMIVSTKKVEDKAIITVTDNGIGISEQNRSKIFDPFFSTRPAGQGTGLGLSVSNKIVEEHGGKIYFDCLNGATRFSIILPLQNNIKAERTV